MLCSRTELTKPSMTLETMRKITINVKINGIRQHFRAQHDLRNQSKKNEENVSKIVCFLRHFKREWPCHGQGTK